MKSGFFIIVVASVVLHLLPASAMNNDESGRARRLNPARSIATVSFAKMERASVQDYMSQKGFTYIPSLKIMTYDQFAEDIYKQMSNALPDRVKEIEKLKVLFEGKVITQENLETCAGRFSGITSLRIIFQ